MYKRRAGSGHKCCQIYAANGTSRSELSGAVEAGQSSFGAMVSVAPVRPQRVCSYPTATSARSSNSQNAVSVVTEASACDLQGVAVRAFSPRYVSRVPSRPHTSSQSSSGQCAGYVLVRIVRVCRWCADSGSCGCGDVRGGLERKRAAVIDEKWTETYPLHLICSLQDVLFACYALSLAT